MKTHIHKPGKPLSLKEVPTKYQGEVLDEEAAKKLLKEDRKALRKLQEKLYAHKRYSYLLIFQAMDAAGKDSTIKHVMRGVNPQGCMVHSFKAPSTEEKAHDFLWRCQVRLPRKGMIGIFNRSYYEEVLVTRVHPEFILGQSIPGIKSVDDIKPEFWENRFHAINAFEKKLVNSGTIILKFFLHVSKDEQAKRFLDRINRPEKNWKFSSRDLVERGHWEDYQYSYQEAIQKTSTDWAPWHIIPADEKWYMQHAVADIFSDSLKALPIDFPKLSPEEIDRLTAAKIQLMKELNN